ncbi:MAG: hypothetical protein WBG81_03080 [Rhodanobacter sp.]|uniref:hypothetical protein n=1 Tax=Rhodanobacter sp. KK11 TaxID=3083255 RepID=UPI0029675F23|nr:hypothetical protein [Rhodanobacter sp. KK11]MDW2980438.1 hypothetical protein [Rhodanobacter sp. KK11]
MTKISPWLPTLACLALAGCEPAPPPAQSDAPVTAVSTGVPVMPAPIEPAPAPAPATPGSAPTKPFAFAAEAASATMACGFDGLQLPPSARVYAAGAYGGSRQDFQIDQSGHEATRMDVAVNQPDVPVVLMLGNYEPTVWNIGWAPGTRILAVLVGGYHHQVVTGLPASVPVQVSTYENRGGCGYFYVTPEKAGTLNPIARRVFGRPVDMLYPARDGKVAIGMPLATGTALVTDGAAKAPSAFRLPNSQLAGPAGLEQAVRDGFLREADASDGAAWVAARQARPAARGDAPPIAGGTPPPRMPSMFRAYVVLKAYTLPAGLYGANSATFFVPKGVPRPTGPMGHSTLYDFNTLSCAGTACGRE